MYGNLLDSDPDLSPLLQGRDPALAHRGSHDRLLQLHERHAALAAAGNHPDVPPVEPLLLRRLADARTLMSACDDLRRRGPRAPGENGRRLENMGHRQRWSMCNAVAQAIRSGTYRPGPDRKVPIPKPGKPGEYRTLTIQNAEDRVVGRATVRILQPVVDPLFSPLSFGFRPLRGPQTALATALAYAQDQGRWAWVSVDVAKAFDNIPFNRFLDACRTHFPTEIVGFIETLAWTGRGRGQRQGSPASPFFANVFFDHHLDWPWRRLFPDLPLFRYVDDLALLCRNTNEAVTAHGALTLRLTNIGTPLKDSVAPAVTDLAAGGSVDWLGYQVSLENGLPAVRIAGRAWTRLAGQLAAAHLLPASPIRALQIVRGWLGYLGPCFMHEERREVIQRVREVAEAAAFDELPADTDLLEVWNAAHARWTTLYANQAAALHHRLWLLNNRVTRSRPRCHSTQGAHHEH